MVWDLGWVDSGFGCSLGFLAAAVTTYCPGRMVEVPLWNIQNPSQPNRGLRPPLSPCTSVVYHKPRSHHRLYFNVIWGTMLSPCHHSDIWVIDACDVFYGFRPKTQYIIKSKATLSYILSSVLFAIYRHITTSCTFILKQPIQSVRNYSCIRPLPWANMYPDMWKDTLSFCIHGIT